jgi:hypothetical protein
MTRRTIMIAGLPIACLIIAVTGCVVVHGDARPVREHDHTMLVDQDYDYELARLLVKLERQTRAVVASHYVEADAAHRDWMAERVLLPAGVADRVFYQVVPETTNGRAWVKMVVDAPRNPHNAGDATAIALLNEIKTGAPYAQRSTPAACYYAEPIKAAKTCLLCHGAPTGEPDPYFPQYKKNGWQEGQIIGAIVARVEPGT